MLAFRRQPLKGLYLTYQLIATLFVRVPFWILLSIPRSWRPRTTWTIKRTILLKLLRQLIKTEALTGPITVKTPDYQAITPGKNVQGVWVGEANHLITGDLKIWADTANVTSVRVPGYWTHKKGTSIKVASPPQPNEKVVYFLHGGGYVSLSAHPSSPTSAIERGLLKHVEPVTRLFSLEYRLAVGKPKPAHPFPTQLLDALAGYNYLVNVVGFSPNDIIIVGDSAGANLAHALTMYLSECKDTTDVVIPASPGAVILLSPWVDLGVTHINLPKGSAKTLIPSDYLNITSSGNKHATDAFIGPHGHEIAEINPYISPASLDPGLHVNYKKFPRTFIVGGGAEVLIDSIRTLRDRMVKDLGEGNGVKEGEGKIRYFEAPDGFHDYLVFTFHEPERTNTLVEINKWVLAT